MFPGEIWFPESARLRNLTGDDLDYPPVAPDVAVEILSKRDRDERGRNRLAEKRDVYLAAGALRLNERDTLQHAALPGFALRLSDVFRVLDPRR